MADNEMRIKIRVDQSEYQNAMKSMGKAQNNLSNQISQTNKTANSATFGAGNVAKASKGVLGLGKAWISGSLGLGTFTAAATPATLAIAAGGKAAQVAGKFVKDSVMAYGDFQGTLKQVQIITGGTQKDFELLGDTAIDIGSKTSMGAQEVAEAEVEFAKLGFSAQETAKAMTGIVYAAEASGSSVQLTSTIVGDALNIWQMGADKSMHIADVLAQTANVSAADMSDLGYTIQYAGAAASQAGLSFEDTAAMAALMANNGIRGSKAGTSIRTAMTNLISPTDNAAAALESVGVQLKDTEGNARPIKDVLKDLREAFHGLSKEQQLELATKIFGKVGAAGMVAYLKGTQTEVDNLTQSLVNSSGTAEKQAKKMRETFKGQLDQLGDSVDAIKLRLGGMFEPLATKGLKTVNSTLDQVDNKIKGLQKTLEFNKAMDNVFGGLTDSLQLAATKATYSRTEVGKFADAVVNMDKNAQTMQLGQIWTREFQTADNQIKLVSDTFKSLDAQAKDFTFLKPEQLTQLQTDSALAVGAVQNMMGLIAIEGAKAQADPNYNPTAALAAGIQQNMPNLQAGLQGQLTALQTSHTNQIGALQTFFANSDTISGEHAAQTLALVQQQNGQQEQMMSDRNTRILELYGQLATDDTAARQAHMAEIQSLEQQNLKDVESINKASGDSIIMTLQAQMNSQGEITTRQKKQAIEDANQQATETIKAAQDQYTQSVAAINRMSDEQVAATGKTREQLISDARDQATQTISQAETMRKETVDKIEAIKVKAENTDGKKITLKAIMEGYADVIGKFNALREAARNPIQFVVTRIARNITENIEKARGGLTSGVPLGMGSGQATSYSGASAMGIGTQLGQGGISQGVTTNERGREVTMPVSNATYMRPFARAIADELSAMGGIGESGQQIVVPLYVNGREFARATSEDMTREQDKFKTISNRAIGKN